MAWAPSTSFEEDFVDLHPQYNFVQGQMVYDAERNHQEYIPRPKSTYEYLEKRQRLNQQLDHESTRRRAQEDRDSLALMERIQEIAGTKPLGHQTTMSDWDDRSTVDKEIIAMMRHFNMNSAADGPLPKAPQLEPENQPKIHIIKNRNRTYPLLLDPSYFVAGRTRKSSSSKNKLNDSPSSTVYFTAESDISQNSEKLDSTDSGSQTESKKKTENRSHSKKNCAK